MSKADGSLSSPAPQYYSAFKVKYRLGMQDPEETEARHHTVLFIETDLDGAGWIHDVSGDLTSSSGMQYLRTEGCRPEICETFYNKKLLGRVHARDYPAAVERVCHAHPPPHRQKAFNAKTMRTEACRPDGTFYSTDEPRPRFFKCTEWIEDKVIPDLYRVGIIQQSSNAIISGPCDNGDLSLNTL
ncbi:MAG: hypothetical protein M1837_000493 [Sclerophora amabilis]|nr:MAG: hypothetical protein M1837_000493 [Sclerophora amabilis]